MSGERERVEALYAWRWAAIGDRKHGYRNGWNGRTLEIESHRDADGVVDRLVELGPPLPEDMVDLVVEVALRLTSPRSPTPVAARRTGAVTDIHRGDLITPSGVAWALAMPRDRVDRAMKKAAKAGRLVVADEGLWRHWRPNSAAEPYSGRWKAQRSNSRERTRYVHPLVVVAWKAWETTPPDVLAERAIATIRKEFEASRASYGEANANLWPVKTRNRLDHVEREVQAAADAGLIIAAVGGGWVPAEHHEAWLAAVERQKATVEALDRRTSDAQERLNVHMMYHDLPSSRGRTVSVPLVVLEDILDRAGA